MFRAHVLIIRRSKLHYTASGIITPIDGRPGAITNYYFLNMRGETLSGCQDLPLLSIRHLSILFDAIKVMRLEPQSLNFLKIYNFFFYKQ